MCKVPCRVVIKFQLSRSIGLWVDQFLPLDARPVESNSNPFLLFFFIYTVLSKKKKIFSTAVITRQELKVGVDGFL